MLEHWRILAILAVLAPTPAVADYTRMAPVRPLTMSDPSGLSSVGLEFQLTKWTERPPGLEVDFTSITFDLTADIKLAPHWLLIARVPFSQVGIDGDPVREDCCSLALGNLTVGGRGLWSSILPTGVQRVIGGELSLSLPTASDSGESGVSAGAAGLARLPHDPGRYLPDTTTIRFTVLGQLYSRLFLAHAEAGLQLFLFDDAVVNNSSDLGVRLALAVGVRATYKIAILAELNTLILPDQNATSLDLGLRYGSGRGIFGLRVYYPLDSPLRDLDMLGVGLDAGLRF